MTSEHLPPAQWYPDPHRADFLRYWDGAAWTDHTHPTPVEVVPERVAEVKRQRKGKITKLTDEEFEEGLTKRIQDVLDALSEGDAESAEGLVYHLEAFAAGRRGKVGLAQAKQRLSAERNQLGLRASAPIGNIDPEGFRAYLVRTGKLLRFQGTPIGGKIIVYADKIVQDGSAHRIDEYTQAQVFLDGQKLITTRPSLTALALFSPLPGSALGPALAFPKTETHDLRMAEFQVTGAGWSCSVAVSPDSLSSARSLAARVNALADQSATRVIAQHEASTPSTPGAGAPLDVVEQIERIVKLQESGAISAEQAEVLKAKVIAG